MRTVFIVISHGAAAKNILRTDVIKTLLREPHLRVICLMKSTERVLSYRKEIAHEHLIYDSFYRIPEGLLERLLSFLKFRLIRTATTDLRHLMSYDEHGNFVRYAAGMLFNRILARASVRRVLRFFDYHFIGDAGCGVMLEKYSPDVVFLTHLFDDVEVSLLREARRREIQTIGFINSWDKLTARCSIRLLPDTLVVFNNIVKKEAIEHADMPEEKIAVCGIPQYDQYITDQPSPRNVFFKKIGLDFTKHLILFSPLGINFSVSDWAIIDLLHEAISRGEVRNAQFLARFPPNDFLDEEELKKRPWLKYDLPGRRFGTKRSVDWDMGFEELKHLTDTLAHTSIAVCYYSSIAVDAAVFDKPTICIDFEIKQNLLLAKSPTEYYKTDHFIKALRPGGIRLVKSREELIEAVNSYIQDPSRDRAGRRRLAEEQCWKLDGKSGERVAKVILEKLRNKDTEK